MFYYLNHGNHGKLFHYHSYERQGIHTKNPFDKILSLNFNLRPLKWTPIALEGINFTKDY